VNQLEKLYKTYPLYKELFTEQLAFAVAPSRLISALCSSRSGKTTVCAVIGIQELLIHPNSIGYYMALTKESVRDIFIPAARPILEKYNIKCEILKDCIKFSNGSKLVMTGANHPNVVETFRGLKLRFCIIDEAASFNQSILQYLIDEVIMLRLSDLQGKLMLIGTPAAHCSGMFYEITTGQETGWDVIKWNGFNNPFMKKQFEADVKLFMDRKKCNLDNPKLQREYFGVWAADIDELMIKPFTVQHPPRPYNEHTWNTVLGLDIGFNDDTVISCIGWDKNNPTAYVLETVALQKSSVSKIAETLLKMKARYKPLRIVVDPAGASKTLMQEFWEKYQITTFSAKKTDKAHYIEIFNDALIHNRLIFNPNSTLELQKECKSLVWNEERTREHEGIKCDHFDATLYAYRESLAYLEKVIYKEERTPEVEAREMLAKVEASFKKPRLEQEFQELTDSFLGNDSFFIDD